MQYNFTFLALNIYSLKKCKSLLVEGYIEICKNFYNLLFYILFMDIWKFLKSFNTTGTYLIISTFILFLMIIYFYIIHPT
ncbi:hypothetical protein F931_00664 [Acinetobacter pittii ANC 4050]|uniref:Uncharacterized protein n=1 Tax=Acinetobacter pittii ANC 4050 TaxID=1217691 RepID=R8YN94_ACIPI|nr:hypothetical protein F931_00664 [Acinetobacter pittii ANC 4050]